MAGARTLDLMASIPPAVIFHCRISFCGCSAASQQFHVAGGP
jgi:hypothetical protein